MAVMVVLGATALAPAVSVDPSERYDRDGANRPVCLVGYRSARTPADLDANGMVDPSDFGLFWQCPSAPGRSPGC